MTSSKRPHWRWEHGVKVRLVFPRWQCNVQQMISLETCSYFINFLLVLRDLWTVFYATVLQRCKHFTNTHVPPLRWSAIPIKSNMISAVRFLSSKSRFLNIHIYTVKHTSLSRILFTIISIPNHRLTFRIAAQLNVHA